MTANRNGKVMMENRAGGKKRQNDFMSVLHTITGSRHMQNVRI